MREKSSSSHEKHNSSHSLIKKCKKHKSSDERHSAKEQSSRHVSGVQSDEGSHRKKCSRRRERFRSSERDGSNSQKTADIKDHFNTAIKEEPLSDIEAVAGRSRSPIAVASRSVNRESRARQNDDDGEPGRRKNESKRDKFRNAIRGEGGEEEHEWGRKEDDKKKKPVENVAKPDFGLSGKLAEETNVYNGVVIKYSEPEEARKPKVRWRLYPFKGEENLPVLHLHRQSAYLIGRDRLIADLPVDHPSCSKQHAVLQYRLVNYTRPNGSTGKRIRPYIIDLDSANGTYVNNKKIEPRKYVELLERDVIKFAYSSREYVLLHEHSKDDNLDDDVE